MLENWREWCYLCAKIDSPSEDALHKVTLMSCHSKLIVKYFEISIEFSEEIIHPICIECSIFLEKLENFKDRCVNALKMHQEIMLNNASSSKDLQAIRFKHGFDKEKVAEKQFLDSDLPSNPASPHKSDDDLPLTRRVKKESLFAPQRKRRMSKKCPKSEEIVCEICSKNFSRRSVLKEHILEQHRQQEMPHSCSQCAKRFTNKYKLRMHENTHLSDSERRIHPCPLCEKKFGLKALVQSHISAIHIGDKPFICEECGKSFRTKGALLEHQTSHSDDRPYHCSACPKKFKKSQHLKMHEESHRTDLFECPHCDLKLRTSRTLKMHLLVHSDSKQYKCDYCGNEYKRAKTLKEHLILHTGQRPYQCPFCDKAFANGSNCRSHKKKAHPVELAALEASGDLVKPGDRRFASTPNKTIA